MAFQPIDAHNDGLDISTAQTLTPPARLADGIAILCIQAVGQNARITMDGSTPTATKGFQIAAGTLMYWEVGPGGVAKVIQEAATCDLQYQWGK